MNIALSSLIVPNEICNLKLSRVIWRDVLSVGRGLNKILRYWDEVKVYEKSLIEFFITCFYIEIIDFL